MNKKEQWYTTKLENFIASCKLDGIEYDNHEPKTLEELYAMYMKDENLIQQAIEIGDMTKGVSLVGETHEETVDNLDKFFQNEEVKDVLISRAQQLEDPSQLICISGEEVNGVHMKYTSEYLSWNLKYIQKNLRVDSGLISEEDRGQWLIDNPEPEIKFRESELGYSFSSDMSKSERKQSFFDAYDKARVKVNQHKEQITDIVGEEKL